MRSLGTSLSDAFIAAPRNAADSAFLAQKRFTALPTGAAAPAELLDLITVSQLELLDSFALPDFDVQLN